MERKITLNDVQKAVCEAYEHLKCDNGCPSGQHADHDESGDLSGISMILTDGRNADKGNTDRPFVIGNIVKLPLSVVLLTQNSPEALVKKCLCHCGCDSHGHHKSDMPFGRHGLRAVSAIEPTGDSEGKMRIINDMIVALSGSEPAFCDKSYKAYRDEIAGEDARQCASAEGLYDDACLCADIYSRLLSLKMSVKQLATMGATVAADGHNPYSGEYAFDGLIAKNVVAKMATHGHHFIKPWMMLTGLPAIKSRTGGMLAVMPGVGAIAAYAPGVDEPGIPMKAAKAIGHIARELGLNVFASAHVEVEK